jgi:RNA polymerase sigma-70 factor (ECF subfamily)
VDQPPDRETLLVVLAQQGRVDAFERLMALHERALLYYIRRQAGDIDRALDVSQETWLAVWKSLPRLRSPEAFRPWLYQVARQRTLLEHRRNAKHQRERKDEITAEDAPAPEAAVEESIDLAELRQTVDRLCPRWREVIVLHYVAELSVEEIALAVGCSAGTVKSRLYYARQELKRLWAGGSDHVPQ